MNFTSLPGKNHNELVSIHPFSDIYGWFTEYSCRHIGFDHSCKDTTNEYCIRNIRSSSAPIVSDMLKRFGAALCRDAFYNHKLWSLSTILLAAIGPHIVYRFKTYPVQGLPVSRAHQSLSYIAIAFVPELMNPTRTVVHKLDAETLLTHQYSKVIC